MAVRAAAYAAELNATKHHALALQLEAEAVWSTPGRALHLCRLAAIHDRVSGQFRDRAAALDGLAHDRRRPDSQPLAR